MHLTRWLDGPDITYIIIHSTTGTQHSLILGHHAYIDPDLDLRESKHYNVIFTTCSPLQRKNLQVYAVFEFVLSSKIFFVWTGISAYTCQWTLAVQIHLAGRVGHLNMFGNFSWNMGAPLYRGGRGCFIFLHIDIVPRWWKALKPTKLSYG